MATENDKVNTGALATLVVVGTASMIGISLAVNALVRHEVGNVGAAREGQGELAYQELRNQELQKLSSPAALSDAGSSHVSIPIERAMNLVLADLKRSPWNATPAPPPDAGADAAVETVDAGADAALEASDAGPTAEPPGGPSLSPSVPAPPTSAPLAPAPRPSAVPAAPPAPVSPTPAAPTAAAPPAAPTPPASPAPPATP